MGKYFRLFAAACMAVFLLVVEKGILIDHRFAHVPGGSIVAALATAAIFGLALFVWCTEPRFRRPGVSAVRTLTLVPVILLAAGFVVPPLGGWLESRRKAPASVPHKDSETIAALRELVAAQEQYRLVAGSYAPSVDSLRRWFQMPAGARLELRNHKDEGWRAMIAWNSTVCRVWVRDTLIREQRADAEGVPSCGVRERSDRELVHSILPASRTPPTHFTASDTSGEWLQHRGSPERTGIASYAGDSSYSWTTRVGGELRSSAAVVGDQVFVGAHGNGEFTAMSFRTGAIGYRFRTPNWIHHEPAVTRDFIALGFGNNEDGGIPYVLGTPPSGVAVYDRRTGVEQWRRYTTGSVMTTPVISGSVIAAVSGAGEAVAWRLSDGKELWRQRLPGFSAMANPLLTDSVMVVSVERTTVCGLKVGSGQILYCNAFSPNGWGAGLVSTAGIGRLGLVVIGEPADRVDPHARRLPIDEWIRRAKRPFTTPVAHGIWHREVLVAFDLLTGTEKWRTTLDQNDVGMDGHTAGTPAVVGGVAFVPLPTGGKIVAVRTDSGALLWSNAVMTARGSVLVTDGAVIAATQRKDFVVLDANTGALRCRGKLPAGSDRAGPVLAGSTAILTLVDGSVLARPKSQWLTCRI